MGAGRGSGDGSLELATSRAPGKRGVAAPAVVVEVALEVGHVRDEILEEVEPGLGLDAHLPGNSRKRR